MALFFRELRGNLKSFLIWTIVIMAIIAMFMAMYPAFASQGETINEMLENFPDEVLDIFSMNTLNFADVSDYIAYAMQFVMLGVFIQFVLMGARFLAKEEDQGTINFLYAKPVSRSGIFFAKFLSGVVYAAVSYIFLTAISLFMMEMVAPAGYSAGTVTLLFTLVFYGELLFLCVGMLLSVMVKKARTIMSASIGIVLGLYIVSIAANLNKDIKILSYLTPFKYFDAVAILKEKSVSPAYMMIVAGVMVVCLAAASIVYSRKDMKG